MQLNIGRGAKLRSFELQLGDPLLLQVWWRQHQLGFRRIGEDAVFPLIEGQGVHPAIVGQLGDDGFILQVFQILADFGRLEWHPQDVRRRLSGNPPQVLLFGSHELKDLLRAEIDGDPQISRIVILNRRKPVKELYRYVCDYVPQCCKNINVHMLSTDLTPFDRRQVLDRLHPPFILVTTQVVEAGVNISAPQVWRDIAPLDAIIQSAGRCNRNWERNEGEVRLVQLVTDHGRMAVPPYDGFLVQTTLDVLAGKNEILEQEFYSLAQRYYRLLRQRSEPTRLQEIMANGDIHKIDGPEGFVLIEERPSQSYFIIRDDAGRRIWDEYTALLNIRDFFARRRAFNKIRREFMERIVQQPTQGRTGEIIPVYPDDRKYSETTGLENMDDGYMIL